MSDDGSGHERPRADAEPDTPAEPDAPEDTGAADREPEPAGTDTATSVEGRVAWLAAVVAILVAAAFVAGPPDFALDDAWIHLSYAKSLRLGDGASYNPGDYELGFSSPLWLALLALWPIAGDPLLPVQLLGVLLHGLTAWVAAHLGLSLARDRASDERPLPLMSLTLLAGVLTAVTPTLVRGATSGMEVSLASALVLAVAWAAVEGRVGAAGVLGALAVWARPEALGFVVALATVLVPWRHKAGDTPERRRAPLIAALAAAAALLAWMLYCQWAQGQWWPNAQAVKGEGGGLAGLGYLRARVLPWQPWLVSLTGVVVLGLALRSDLRERRPEVLALLLAAVGTWVAIAVTRPLDPAVLFFQARYFAPVAGVFAVLIPLGLPRKPRWLGPALVLPIAVISGIALRSAHREAQAQRADTHQVHGAVAQAIAALPRDARVAVEGAGAPRFFAARSQTIIDLVGLNDHEMAQVGSDTKAKFCHVVRQRPTHFAIPAEWIDSFAPVFALQPIARFDDPRYTQVDPPRPLSVVLLEVVEIHPAWVDGCG